MDENDTREAQQSLPLTGADPEKITWEEGIGNRRGIWFSNCKQFTLYATQTLDVKHWVLWRGKFNVGFFPTNARARAYLDECIATNTWVFVDERTNLAEIREYVERHGRIARMRNLLQSIADAARASLNPPEPEAPAAPVPSISPPPAAALEAPKPRKARSKAKPKPPAVPAQAGLFG